VRDDGRREHSYAWGYDSLAREHSPLPDLPVEIPPGESRVVVPVVAPPGEPFMVEIDFLTGDRQRTADGSTPTPVPDTAPVPGTTPTPVPFEPHPEHAERNSYAVQWFDTSYEKLNHVDGTCAYGPGATTGGGSGSAWHSQVSLHVEAPPLQRAIVASALSQVGRPYIWGGVNNAGIGDCLSPIGCFPAGYHRDFPGGTTGFDCSGLMIWAYAQNGITIPWRTTLTQFPNLNDVAAVGGLQPGDMGYYGFGSVSHVGMLIGDVGTSANDPTPDGKWDFVHAPHVNGYVRVEYNYFETYEPYAGLIGYRTPRGMELYPGY
jgi:cell wall-associated NlpC family hydrolase